MKINYKSQNKGGEKMKRIYLKPEAELVRFYEEDVITTSNPEEGNTGNETGDDLDLGEL